MPPLIIGIESDPLITLYRVTAVLHTDGRRIVLIVLCIYYYIKIVFIDFY